MGGRLWTEEEISILKEKYPEQGSDIPELNRTRKAIRLKARELGLSAPRQWTEEEVAILKEKYPEQGTNIPELNRTQGAIQKKASNLGLSAPRWWTEEEVSILKEKYPKQGSDIPELDKTRQQIWSKAKSLGLSADIDRRNHITVSDPLREYLDGLLLGDGCIISRKSGSAYYTHSDKHKEYIVWLKKKLESLGLSCGKITKNPYGYPMLNSTAAVELNTIRERWYPNGEKQIPHDLVITPTILKSWYIGDGSYTKQQHGSGWQVEIACSFDREGKQRLTRQINHKTQIEAHNTKAGILIMKETHQAFFKYILSQEPEVPPGYKYKFPDKYLTEKFLTAYPLKK